MQKAPWVLLNLKQNYLSFSKFPEKKHEEMRSQLSITEALMYDLLVEQLPFSVADTCITFLPTMEYVYY